MSYTNLSKEEMKQEIISNVKSLYRKKMEDATPQEIYQAAVFAVKDIITDKWIKTHDEYKKKGVKIVYYLSMEFLMGRFLGNAVMNLMMYDEIREAFTELGIDYNLIEDMEPDP